MPRSGPVLGAGCSSCSRSGYRGRTGVFEVLRVTAQMRRSLLVDPTERTLAAVAAGSGHLALRQSALSAAAKGWTTYEEVLRATQGETGP